MVGRRLYCAEQRYIFKYQIFVEDSKSKQFCLLFSHQCRPKIYFAWIMSINRLLLSFYTLALILFLKIFLLDLNTHTHTHAHAHTHTLTNVQVYVCVSNRVYYNKIWNTNVLIYIYIYIERERERRKAICKLSSKLHKNKKNKLASHFIRYIYRNYIKVSWNTID